MQNLNVLQYGFDKEFYSKCMLWFYAKCNTIYAVYIFVKIIA